MTRIHLAVSATVWFSIALLPGCSSHRKSTASRSPIPVQVKRVKTTSDAALARYSGSLEPAAHVDIAFRVGGYVETLGQATGSNGKPRTIEEGDFVKQGTVLARIRSADYSQTVATARAGISEARAELTLADAELVRAQKLFETNSISKAELDAKVARAASAHATVEAATARAGQAGVALEDTVIKAPMDGVILMRDLEIGTLVSPGRPVLEIADISTVKAKFAVPEAIVEKLAVGSPLSVQVGSEDYSRFSGRLLDARVTRIAPAADSKGRVFSVEAELPNASGALRPGSVISVRLPEDALFKPSLAVPLSAIVRSRQDPRGFAVFVIDGEGVRGKARSQQVALGDIVGNAVTVESGLSSGQRVVTVGATLIQDGSDTLVAP